MLHDPSHRTPLPVAEEVRLTAGDTDILRRLAAELAEIAALPVHKEKARLWQKLNDLESVRPMVWINEICWHEMNVDDELTLRTEHPWAQEQERDLRRTLYQWRHLPGDMIVDDYLACPLAIHSTDFGIIEDVDIVTTDDANDIVSRHFHVQIRDFADLEKIKMPVVTHNEAATELRYEAMCDVYAGIMPVRKVGQTHIWFTPWDYLIRWWGIEEAMIDLVERPELVHAGVERMVDAWMVELDQFVAQNLLCARLPTTRASAPGGYGYTSKLPGQDLDPDYVQAAQHVGLLERPDLLRGLAGDALGVRRQARSALARALGPDLLRLLRAAGPQDRHPAPHPQPAQDLGQPLVQDRPAGSRRSGNDYVLSRKPNPAVFADDGWHPERARQDLRSFLEKARGLPRGTDHERHLDRPLPPASGFGSGQPIAMEVAEEFAV